MGFTNPTPLRVVGKVALTPTGTIKKITTPSEVINPANQPLQVGDDLIVVGQGTWATTGTAGTIFTATFTTPALTVSYGALVVFLGYKTGTMPVAVAAISGDIGRFVAPIVPTSATRMTIVPFANAPGAKATIELYGLGAGTGGYTIAAMTSNPGVELRGSTGRVNPVGSIPFDVITGGTAIAAPPPPLRIYLHSMRGYGIASSSTAAGTLTVYDGADVPLAFALAAGGAASLPSDLPGNGLLLSEASGLAIATSNLSEWRVAGTYDLVP